MITDTILYHNTLASGLIFELPIIIYFLSKIGIVTPEFLRRNRKYALVLVLVIAAIITPPDIASQIIVVIPILILYQVSIYISKVVVRNQKRKEKKQKENSTVNYRYALILIEFFIFDNLAIQPELLYSTVGAKYDTPFLDIKNELGYIF